MGNRITRRLWVLMQLKGAEEESLTELHAGCDLIRICALIAKLIAFGSGAFRRKLLDSFNLIDLKRLEHCERWSGIQCVRCLYFLVINFIDDASH